MGLLRALCISLGLCALLIACGQKGDLYLPTDVSVETPETSDGE